ncbi:MAG: YggS family pyridoxal phosphate-dependent enzyme [Gammaproteobacteria bacterium AqS3]|nr:YggS family pyridoxal phosphate-dependent enzyme [Gammaproteobacteria bacterium AqS3]
MSSPAAALARVRAGLDEACQCAGRAGHSVSLLAVSKGHPAGAVRELAGAGQCDFGENYVQEALAKIDALSDLTQLHWHFIGRVQGNKTRAIAERFDWCHSVDKLTTARRLSNQRPETLPPLQVCVQVNLDGGADISNSADISNTADSARGGADPEALDDLLREVALLPRLKLRGLMVLPPPEAPEPAFAHLAELLAKAPVPLDVLSMGMSADYPAAIRSGANWVRIGTALFGPRPSPGRSGADTKMRR